MGDSAFGWVVLVCVVLFALCIAYLAANEPPIEHRQRVAYVVECPGADPVTVWAVKDALGVVYDQERGGNRVLRLPNCFLKRAAR